jgi:adenosylmethionine-8-amino-7-oxononanoate aminotransferase
MIREQQERNYFVRDFNSPFYKMVRGEGFYIFDQNGRKYFDATSGIAVVNIGHGREQVVNRLAEQAQKLSFTTTVLFSNPVMFELADQVAEMTPGDLNTTFFTSGGSESTDTAIKLARQYHLLRGKVSKSMVIARWQSFHGTTLYSLGVSGLTGRRRAFQPYFTDIDHIAPNYCYRCPYDQTYPGCAVKCARDLERVIEQHGDENVSAFIAEPIVGAAMGGVCPPIEYYRIIRDICDRHDVLFICDEVICGFGRTGKNFGIEHWGVLPDIITTAKGMASGYAPLGGVTVNDRIKKMFIETKMPFIHGYTFSANPTSCAAGSEVLKIINEEKLVARVAELESFFFDQGRSLLNHKVVGDVRGKGLFMGVEIVKDSATKEPFPASAHAIRHLFDICFERQIIIYPCSGAINGVRGDHFLVCPPFTSTKEVIRTYFDGLNQAIAVFQKQTPGS